jgi:hypothetical protein
VCRRQMHVAQSVDLSLKREKRFLRSVRGGHGLCSAPWGKRLRSANTTF